MTTFDKLTTLDELNQKITVNKAITAIIGLGYVGLPLMHSICKSGGAVLGFDIDPAKIDMLNNGQTYLDTVPQDHVKSHVDEGLFSATDDFARLTDTDVIVICVPTPLDHDRAPDLSYVIKTTQSIAKTLRRGQMVILESTTYPGTLDEVMRPILEKTSGLVANEDFYLAFSPEREDPGNPNFETATIPKVVGADTKEVLDTACAYYANFLREIVPVANSRTAEAVKITENVFRAVNIALVNELKVIYEAMGVDVWDVIEAAKTKPFGYMPFYPGPGLGGHCIPIDPFYLTWKAAQSGVPTRFIELAGEINTAMPLRVVEKLEAALKKRRDMSLKDARILMLGVAYKKNVNDQRESPAFPIMHILKAKNAVVDFYDPHLPEILPSRHYAEFSGQKSIETLDNGLHHYDAVLLITDHDQLPYEKICDQAGLIIDTRNAFAARGLIGDHIIKA
jgi:UDP-N-acetyl-D-glucosamine dehydrogenase